MADFGDLYVNNKKEILIYTGSSWEYIDKYGMKPSFVNVLINENNILKKRIKELEAIIKEFDILFD